jgi:beta-glucosidase
MVNEKSPDFDNVYANAYRIRGQVDVLMPGGDRIAGKGNDSTLKSLKAGGITRGELQRGAKNLLNFILDTPVLREKIKKSE